MTKGATIKLRLSESEKAAWEAQATADGVTLSALVRQRMNNPVVRADGVLETSGTSYARLNPPKQGCPANGKPCHCTGACRSVGTPLTLTHDWSQFNQQLDGATLISELHVEPRRQAACQHARPPYAYCPSCDA